MVKVLTDYKALPLDCTTETSPGTETAKVN